MKADDLKKIGLAVREIADALEIIFANVRTIADVFVEVTEAKKAPKELPQKEEPVDVEASVEEAPALTLEEVRGRLADLSRAGHTEQVKALITKYGADRLSAVDPSNYAALLADAEEIANA